MKRKLAISLADKIIALVEDALKNDESHFNTHLDFALKKLDDDHNAIGKLCHMLGLNSLSFCKEANGEIEAISNPVFIDVFSISRESDPEAYREAILRVLDENMSSLITHAISDVKDIYGLDAEAEYVVRCYPVHKLQDPQPIWHIEIKAKAKIK